MFVLQDKLRRMQLQLLWHLNIGIPTYPTMLTGTLFTRDPKLPKPSSEFRLNGTYQKLSFPTFPIGSHVPKMDSDVFESRLHLSVLTGTLFKLALCQPQLRVPTSEVNGSYQKSQTLWVEKSDFGGRSVDPSDSEVWNSEFWLQMEDSIRHKA